MIYAGIFHSTSWIKTFLLCQVKFSSSPPHLTCSAAQDFPGRGRRRRQDSNHRLLDGRPLFSSPGLSSSSRSALSGSPSSTFLAGRPPHHLSLPRPPAAASPFSALVPAPHIPRIVDTVGASFWRAWLV
ncbi:unnamed protein product [Tilletia laevis]|uniref:Uncharacterized protein n=2 Tax=Tilletia TaxID=13289 RepID=A0A8T8SRR3_9BASI|nr:hypothetical protein CF336_g6797 [Tilletia laevis]KAE8245707.1 hypothetical protein A4X03_0g7445 [Tilletia caries]CAD6897923.1 unnamed protein product [Tilletia controversa]KAE8191218.1 hypothetical protein CF335_g6145 [Tilletia laevis]CAD6887898.1 unnamed protein product [Tilletia caries]